MTLRSKLAAILIALVGTTALVVSVLGYRAARAGTLPSLISDLDSRASLVSLGFQALVMGGTQDARTVAAVLASLATVRDGASEESEDLLRAMAEGKPQYLQVRLLGRTGREVLRVDRDPVAGTAHVLPADSLQDKSDRPYVQAGLGLGVGEIYVSPIDLNEEFGQVEEPYVAVLRVVAPIFDSEGELQGLAVFNLDMTRQLAQMRQTGPARTDLYMVSGKGSFWFTRIRRASLSDREECRLRWIRTRGFWTMRRKRPVSWKVQTAEQSSGGRHSVWGMVPKPPSISRPMWRR